MKKYLVLYRSEAALNGISVSQMMASSTPEQMKAGMALWHAWHERTAAATVDLGAPLDRSTSVAPDSSTPNKSSITGYSVLQAESLEAAVALMEGHPHFQMPGATIQVLEAVPMPGM